MNILFLAGSKGVPECLKTVQRSRKIRLEVREASDVTFAAVPDDVYVYVCLDDQDAKQRTTLLDSLNTSFHRRFGVVDPAGVIDDPALLLHRGAWDYIGPALAGSALPTQRFVDLLQPIKSPLRQPEDAPGLTLFRPSGTDWGGISSGREYTFGMLFAYLDESTVRRESLSSQKLESTNRLFRDLVEQHSEPFGGRLWIWRDSGGLVLFPFDGSTAAGIVPALRMHLNRTLIAVEEFSAHTEVSFRLVHHVGTTEYRNVGRTSDVVSDAVNVIFHIGDRNASPGSLVVTDTSMHFCTPKLRKLFSLSDSFEGRRLFRPLVPGLGKNSRKT